MSAPTLIPIRNPIPVPLRSFFLGKNKNRIRNRRVTNIRVYSRFFFPLWLDLGLDSGLDVIMKTRTLLITLLQGFVAANLCLAGDAKLEQALRDLDDQWSKAAVSKDVDKTISYYAADAVVMPPNAAAATTKETIRKVWSEALTAPGATMSWKATKVEVAKSGDIGFVSGTYEYSMNDAVGKPINDKGKYLVVWEKQADGSWKCRADIWNSDMPAAAETK